MSRKKLELLHPETGAINTIDTLKFIVTMLNTEEDIIQRRLYHELPGSMSDRLRRYNLNYVPQIMLLMQELGLLRRRGSQKTTTWFIVDGEYIDEFVSEEWCERARLNVFKHSEMMSELRDLRKRVGKCTSELLSVTDTNNDEQIVEMNNNLAEVIAEVERLKAEISMKDSRILELEAELSMAHSRSDPKAVAEELMARFRKK